MAQWSAIPFFEIADCSTRRLDAGHYMPVHRTWEHYFPNKAAKSLIPTRSDIMSAWIAGFLPESELLKAIKVRDDRLVIPAVEVNNR
ncbi:MAG: hypothetical protein JRN68_00955 [Nitrososphaerota archaeon]|nr:hypothetical protein [Ferrimicrobium acidiphilum]MDG6933244.1 hypothetical protein [Nitrososphaerota archaeon]